MVRAVNGSHWVFYGGLSDVAYTITVTDLKTGRVKRYDNQSGTFASVADTSAFPDASAEGNAWASEGRPGPELYPLFEALSETMGIQPKAAAPCAPGSATLCLAGSRFQVTVDWEIPTQGRSGQGIGVPISSDTGYFWFFNDANVEVAVKVLDGRAIDGHFWIFVAALSDLKYTLRVTDTQTGVTKAWDNPEGRLASWADTGTFSDSAIPIPPPQDLSGTWTGTITFLDPPFEFLPRCQDSASITVDLVESGEALTGQFQAGCSGTFVLQGQLQGTTISGSLEGRNGQGEISGTVLSNRIQFQTISRFDDRQHRDRHPRFTSSTVDLRR